MQPQRLTVHFRLFLLVSVTLLPVTANSQELNERFPNELNSDVEEPRIALPEVHRGSPFRRVSRSRRPSNDELIKLCKESVDTTARRLLSTESHTPWQIMHGLLALRHDFQILHQGQSISGLDWVAQGQIFDDEYWFESSRHGGRAHPYSRPYAFEGHANQFLAILSMCGVEPDRTFGTSSGPITMRGMINNAQQTVKEKDEPTWTLWALSRYLPSSARWRSEDGESWSIEKLVQTQTAKPMQGAPCGGTHGLFALAHARNVYLRQRKPLRGVWLQAEYKIRKYINTARMQQNADGTLSSNFFRGKEYNPDFNKRMASAGHILEFLMIALPQNELGERWVRRAIEAMARDLLNNRKAYVKCSPLYHSVNALNIYLDRVNPMVPSEQIANGRKEAKTAKLTPRNSRTRTPPLKSVPVTSITKSREVADSRKAEGTKSESPGTAPSQEVKAEAEATTPVTVPPVPLREVPEVDDVPETAPEPTAIIIESDPAKWKPTPQERRTAISVDADRINAGVIETASPARPDQSDATNLPDKEDDADTSDDVGVTSDYSVDDDESVPPSDDEEPEPGDLTVAAPPVNSVSKSRVVGTEREDNADSAAAVIAAATESDETPNGPSSLDSATDADTAALSEATQVLSPIVDAIGLSDGMSVAEIGSGTGLFLDLLSAEVGTSGRVFATDASPRLVDLLEKRVAANGLTNVAVVRNDGTSLTLSGNKVDRVFVCDAYRDFQDRVAMLASIQNSLQSGGELIIVESVQPGELPQLEGDTAASEFSRQEIQAAVEDAGFTYAEEITIPDFGGGFVLRFHRAAE
ncbi:MAG: methyltransferase domain-containing protein [Fuerstiella sp.]|nr:methyltransferase domain-containing protein [Fuerstiella sp.]MCP4856584.1 methyltransferase domain-containing protein [Fuerstiella sp.]